MYRDDREALQARADSATREAEQLQQENAAMRQAVIRMQAGSARTATELEPYMVYQLLDLRTVPLEERARLAAHAVRRFPVWLVGLLNVLTLGLFPLIHFGLLHDRLPRAANNDPSAGKAIGFQFIPYYNLYWIFFSALRLCDRLTLQFRLRRVASAAPRGIVLAACICTVIPYVNLFIGIPILWTIAACMLQASVNRVADLDPTQWDASTLDGSAAPAPQRFAAAPGMPTVSPELIARQDKARRLVGWSHLLGWGGIALCVIGAPTMLAVSNAAVAGTTVAIGMICAVVGAIIGQVGRGMQGRAI